MSFFIVRKTVIALYYFLKRTLNDLNKENAPVKGMIIKICASDSYSGVSINILHRKEVFSVRRNNKRRTATRFTYKEV